MIHFLEGEIEELSGNFVVLNVGGIGFGIAITTAAYNSIKGKSGIRISTYMAVREDAMELYGFVSASEKEVFMLLISINGIGPKAAMAILNNTTIDQLKSAIGTGDEAALTRIPGLGSKKAQRLIVELKDKFKNLPGIKGGSADVENEYTEALVSLGFKYNEAAMALKAALKASPKSGKEEIIKEALKRLGK
jgi:holliday junction DNA helicase RuvA